MRNSKRTVGLKLSLIPLLVLIVVLQLHLDPTVQQLQQGQHTGEAIMGGGLSTEFIMGPMLGVGQAVAGLLWVRGDEFFHEGDYDAILPIVRMVTWLDPHQLDVYITGAWHLAYNFCDSDERSDKRYIPAAQALLREGDANNNKLWDCAFELGWETADKVKDYYTAEQWFRTATTRHSPDAFGNPILDPPMYVWHQLAHTLAREGRIPDSVAVWKTILAKNEALKAKNPKDYSLDNVISSEKHNLTLTLERNFSRYKHEIDFAVDAKQTKSVNMETGQPYPANSYLATGPKDGVPIGTPRLPCTARKWDTAFDVRVSFPEPKVLVPKGVFNVGDGARVTIVLHDSTWSLHYLKHFTFDIDPKQTVMVDMHSVRRGKWGRKIDMSRDPKMYSFSADTYYLVFEFNPRETSPFIQDKFGWSGEGMTDKKYLLKVPSTRPGTPDLYMLRKVYKLTRAQIMGEKPVTEADVISNAEYAKEQPAASTFLEQ